MLAMTFLVVLFLCCLLSGKLSHLVTDVREGAEGTTDSE